jgi:hypothetical protein
MSTANMAPAGSHQFSGKRRMKKYIRLAADVPSTRPTASDFP